MSRLSAPGRQALIAQLVERALGKGEVMGSNPIEGSLSRLEHELVLVLIIQGEDHGEAEV
jgi:hypothetical protein